MRTVACLGVDLALTGCTDEMIAAHFAGAPAPSAPVSMPASMPMYAYPGDSGGPSTAGNTNAYPTATASPADSVTAMYTNPPLKIKLGSRLVVADGDSDDSE